MASYSCNHARTLTQKGVLQTNLNRQKPLASRRAFLQSTGAFVVGCCLAGQATARAGKEGPADRETLALNGGPKAVTVPHGDAARWPLYGPEEEGAIVKLIRDPSYAPIDEAEAGMSRAACVRALQAEGVQAKAHTYPLQHKLPLYSEAKWWHHLPTIPELSGSEQANRTTIALPLFTAAVPEVIEQYVNAFEKVWAHRQELGNG